MDYTDPVMDYNNIYTTQYQQPTVNPMVMTIYWIFILIWAILVIAGMWKMFEKAGKPGWAAIIPIYNLYIFIKVAGKPGWWLLLYFIPLVNLVVSIMVSLELAKKFGKSSAFGIFLLWLFQAIGVLILGFGKAKYNAKAAPATKNP